MKVHFGKAKKSNKIYSKEICYSACQSGAAIASAEAEMGLVSQRDADKINAMVCGLYRPESLR
jgi:hypothetical protein